MTNSLNTPAEALEYAYPLRVRQYSLRTASGGDGHFRGGDGIVRKLEVLTDAEVTLLADRRVNGPYGLSGGGRRRARLLRNSSRGRNRGSSTGKMQRPSPQR